MVFSSIPVYLDPPNWQQQPNNQPPARAGNENPQLLQPPAPPPGGGDGSGSAGSIRPGSMTDRARLAKIPLPETALKCPRCESTNTKFCYFNNYSLTQPRHFCKTCRRYWTRGGALRNVPVGGGCRRNKRSKGSGRSKSPVKAGSSSSGGLASNGCTTGIMGHMTPPPPQLPILPPLHHLGDYTSADIGLNFGGIPSSVGATAGGGGGVEFQIGSSTSSNSIGGSILSSGLVEQWRFQQVQQFPFLSNSEPPSGLYSFEGGGIEPSNYAGQIRSKPILDTGVTQLASVKMEDNQGLNLSRNFLGISGNDQYWSGNNAWTDLPGFTSSTSHLL
ncbi:unnamed protein product [Dovyalis caffra]|uniref:Dof zinc finger protein n=1 Tax=Dovyalis caffra TaxID=77055 RepID=A0AAV1QYJ2_9ROSI|nr:unnamed protein product [Dovyalis caffra]